MGGPKSYFGDGHADEMVKSNDYRTAHVYWPEVDKDAEVISLSLYATLHVDCEDECEPEDTDYDMYSFARSTHYWPLHEVFDVHLNCEERSMKWLDEPQLGDARNVERMTELAKIEMAYDPYKCKFSPSSNISFDGCISIRVSPK